MIKNKSGAGADGKNEAYSDDASEISLILSAAGGDESAFNELTVRYTPLLKSSVASFSSGFSEQDTEELYQEALLAFHRAVIKFDPLYGKITFGLYAKVCIANALKSEFKRLSKEASEHVISLDDIPPSEIPAEEDDDIEARTAELRELIRSNLSEYENTVFWSYYSGLSASEIAKQVGKDPKSVENAIFRIRKKLKSLLKYFHN
ncbi:MAG: sigma-70 family RNA polymerase sigma factor [Clostridia bacterium]|nr:sigma-70 family RNA polymerase sigma factor [Clostridia bacterium]